MSDGLYLGKDRESGDQTFLDPDHLTTHAVCLGMTGSGKTGLGIVALEELARRRVPLLIIDLKGDMSNLLLNFPSFAAEDFAPWLPSDALAEGSADEVASATAALWRNGLEGSGLGSADLSAVKDGLDWQILTPGVSSGRPVDILPSLSLPPELDVEAHPDAVGERLDGTVGAILSLIDRGGDPLSDPDHVLVASVLLELWRRGETVDLPRLLSAVADPPLERLGALPLDTVAPRSQRMKLVMALNTLVASPSFAAWTRGTPLSMSNLLGTPDRPKGTIISVAHLDESAKLFFLTLVFSELVAWMRRQPGSSSLRALLYIDEVQGIIPPSAKPPTKAPLMTLLKQGRAFGVGAWLATQNPVDLDYKALGNAGVKLVGRLITDRDRDRALEGLALGASLGARQAEEIVTSLGKRQFLLSDVRSKKPPRVFGSRWAMSYLRGPLALTELGPLYCKLPITAEAVGPLPGAVAAQAETREATTSSGPPVLPVELPLRYAPGDGPAEAAILLRCRFRIERKTLDFDREFEESLLIPIAGGEIDWDSAIEAGELEDRPDPALTFPSSLPDGLGRELKGLEKEVVRWRARRGVDLLVNEKLELVAELDESRDSFLERCLAAADRADDDDQAKIRARFEKKIDTVKRRLERERDELERDISQLDSRKTEEKLGIVEGLFSVLLGSRGLKSAARKAASKARSSATSRRMRQRAEDSVVESENEIVRLEHEIDDIELELIESIEQIAAQSELDAHEIEEKNLRPTQSAIEVLELALVWGPEGFATS